MRGKAVVDVGPLLVDGLINNGRLRSAWYSFYMRHKDEGRSHVDFG